MKKLGLMLLLTFIPVVFVGQGYSQNSQELQMIAHKDLKAQSKINSSINSQTLNETKDESTQDLAQSSTNSAIAINCDKKEYAYEENSQKCIIIGSKSIEEAIKVHLQSKVSDDYEVLRRINKIISTIKLPSDNVKVEHQIQLCLDEEIEDCELSSMSVVITRKSKDEIVIEYAPGAFYQKTYKQNKNEVEVINESYI